MKKSKKIFLVSSVVLYIILFVIGKILQIVSPYYSLGGYLMLFSTVMLILSIFYFSMYLHSRKCPNCGKQVPVPKRIKENATFQCYNCGHVFWK